MYLLGLLFVITLVLLIIVLVCFKDNFDPTVLNNQRPLIWFHHVHKAGGTSFVKLAENNGEKLYYKGEHRNGLPTNRYGYFIPFGKMSKNEQQSFVNDALKNGTTFLATEFDFPKPEEKFHGTVNVIILRDPVDRLISHLAHIIREPESTRKNYKNRNLESTIQENTPYFANIVTKVLSGHSFNYDKELTEQDYEKALENLKSFDTLIILEDPQSYLKMQKYGWKDFNVPQQNESKTRDLQTNVNIDTVQQVKDFLSKWLGPDYRSELNKLCKYDKMLYDYASNQSYKGIK